MNAKKITFTSMTTAILFILNATDEKRRKTGTGDKYRV